MSQHSYIAWRDQLRRHTLPSQGMTQEQLKEAGYDAQHASVPRLPAAMDYALSSDDEACCTELEATGVHGLRCRNNPFNKKGGA